jgi:hypothetical protein
MRVHERRSNSSVRRVERRWVDLALVVMAAIAVMGVTAASASAYIYVAGPVTSPVRGPSTIERLTLDGSFVQPNFIVGPRVESAHQLHVHGDRLYWADSSAGDCRVASASLDGTDVRNLATLPWPYPNPDPVASNGSGCGSALSIALAGQYLYWGGGGGGDGTIGRVSIQDPSRIQADFIRVPDRQAVTLNTDGSWLYWSDEHEHPAIGRARVDGTGLQPALFQPEPATPDRPAMNVFLLGVAQGHLWWDNGYGTGSVGRAGLDGSDPEPAYLTGVQLYDGALTPESLYYTGSPGDEPGSVSVDGAIRRIALQPGATPDLIARRGQGAGYSIAVDALDAPFSVRRIWKHRDGTATAVVPTPRPADVSVHGRRIVPATARHPDPKVARVDIQPRRRAARALRRHRAAHVRVRIKVDPSGGAPWSNNRRLTLHLRRR